MNGISLFNGMGCFSIACQELGLTFDRLYTSEVDKHCLAQTRLNFPNEIEIGDVRNVDVSKLDPIDIIVGGSPCQCFSFAGKRKGMSTTDKMEIHTLSSYLELKAQGVEFEGQSYLFWEYMRILRDVRRYNPKVLFLLENVEMGKKWEAVLTRAIGVEGVHINSALVSAQNRKRIYWTNIAVIADPDGNGVSTIPQPKDRGILLRDILENDVDEKYYLSDKMIKYFNTRASNFNAGKVNIRSLSDKATTLCKSMSSCDISDNFVLDTTLNPKKNQDKASCFTAGAHSGGKHSDMDLICVAMRGRNPDNPSDRRTGAPTEQRLEPNLSGKTNCLTSVQKDNLVMQLNPSKESGGVQPYQQNRIYNTDGIMPALSAQLGGRNNVLLPESRIRRLTPTECARLQTVPEWYRWKCSDTQQYRMLGNGWTIDIISWVLSFLNN